MVEGARTLVERELARMISACCFTSLKTELRTEMFHGNDDAYELKIPFFICSNCGEQVSPLFEHDVLIVSNLGGKSYE